MSRMNGNHVPPPVQNPCYVTVLKGDPAIVSDEDARTRWAAGKKFQVYQHEKQITKDDALKMRMSQFTHVRIIWQRDDHTTVACDIDLSRKQ